ncbi:MAG: tRNA uridine-5-carboxymethylaminomethyl(34) synthesis enzyme MnmG [Candidatus Aminicenantales bacterium]
MPDEFEIVVVGAGHAGCEAACAASAMGLRTCLLTIHLETIAQMSCNPAIGGLAKGHLVREIDALGGIMGLMADETGIQFRLLNSSRGGAVQAPRAQCDKTLYRLAMKKRLESVPNLSLFQGIAAEIMVREGKTEGIRTLDGHSIRAGAVILAPGTFLNGLVHLGLTSYPAGRANEPASSDLSLDLRKKGLKMFRLKTGTPMRLDKHTIDWSRFTPQPGDEPPFPFSYRTRRPLENKIVCWHGYTNELTHEVIRKNLDKSPLYSGKIVGAGPRYCPSIEDKVVKFSHHNRHQFFLEPEGLETSEVYVNGLSSSLPVEVQKEILQTIPGLDQARILRPAYGIEYDAVLPVQLRPTLETLTIQNLYLAGQINGTSGYEEAAAQGIMAGINAALKLKGKKPFILDRCEAYIAVLIDDLVTKGVEEPYRLFTSRAEHRLMLRIDNADFRLMPHGRQLGLIDDQTYAEFLKKKEKIKKVMIFLDETKALIHSGEKITLKSLLKKPEIAFRDVLEYAKFDEPLTTDEIRHIESEVKYEGYIQKQEREIAQMRRVDRMKIPGDLDFQSIAGLTREAVEKLERARPATLGEVKRMPGMTPAAVMNLFVHLSLIKRAEPAR